MPRSENCSSTPLCIVIMRPIRFRSIVWCRDRKSTRLNSSHSQISYAVFCLKKKNNPERVLALFVEDCVLEDVTSGVVARGKAELRSFVKATFAPVAYSYRLASNTSQRQSH